MVVAVDIFFFFRWTLWPNRKETTHLSCVHSPVFRHWINNFIWFMANQLRIFVFHFQLQQFVIEFMTQIKCKTFYSQFCKILSNDRMCVVRKFSPIQRRRRKNTGANLHRYDRIVVIFWARFLILCSQKKIVLCCEFS